MPEGLVKIGTGAQADVYRYPQGGHAVKLYRSTDREGEARWEIEQQSRAVGLGLPAPAVYGYVALDGLPGVEMECIDGETLGEKMIADMANAGRYLDRSVDCQLRLHNTAAEGFPSLHERLEDRIGRAEALNARQRQNLLARLRRLPEGDVVCHGDFHLLNLIDGKSGLMVIDWIDATRGAPAADVARSYLLYALVLQEVAGVYLDVYTEKSGMAREKVIDWLPVVAGARLAEKNDYAQERLLLRIVDELY